MDDANKKLLEEVIMDRLSDANTLPDPEEREAAFKEAMQAADRSIELAKLEETRIERIEKAKIEAEDKRKEVLKDWVTWGVGIVATVVAVPIVEVMCKRRYAKDICNFEKDYTFTTSAGKGLSGLFRFKK